MKKKMRKDVLIARIIFAVIIVVLIGLIVGGILFFVNRNKEEEVIPTPVETQTEYVAPEPEPMPEPEPETETEPVFEQVSVWTTDRVRFREQPNTNPDCVVIATLNRNTELTMIGEEGEFAHVLYGDQEGYVSLDYITYEEPTTNGLVICIDPGHQGSGDSAQEPIGPGSSTTKARVTSGTSGATSGLMEYQLNLQVALKLRDELEARGYTVYMTRETHDINISNMERAQFATSVGADITVRIHANGSDSTSVSGALVLVPSSSNPYVSNLAANSQALGSAILSSYCAATGLANQGVQASDNMTGINWCTMPVTILEMGYMTCPSDDLYMADESNQYVMVGAIADGIDSYFGL